MPRAPFHPPAVPLVALAALSYASGLLAAATLSRATTVALLLVVLGTAVLAILLPALDVRRDHATCLLVGAAGALIALAALERAAACGRLMAGTKAIVVALDSDASHGTVGRGTAHFGACRAHAIVLPLAGEGRAGESVVVRGRIAAGTRGIVADQATLGPVVSRAMLPTMRAAAGRRIDRLFGADAPLVRALVIADMSAIPAEERDTFARAGLVHMLSVSGLHVAIVALALELLATALRLPRTPARVLSLALIVVYVMAIGAPPPAVRAAVMLALLACSRLLQRPTTVWAVVAVGGGAPLVDPAVVLDLGWQLSVAGTIALVAGAALARRVVPDSWRGARRRLASAAIVSIIATLATAPLVAWTFGRIALLGPVTNLIADPIMGVLQPVLFLALCIPVRAVEQLTTGAAHLLIVAFGAVARHAAALPFASPEVMPTVAGAVAGAVAASAVIVACLAERPARAVLVALGAVALMTLEPFVPAHRAFTELHMLDVGQGDALALRTRGGRWIVIDAGRSWIGGDAGRSTVVPYLAHRGGEVALFVLSHPHADHVGGAASLFAALHPAIFLDPGYVGTSGPYRTALAEARRSRIPWRRVHPGDSLVIDEVVLTALAPDSVWASRLADANLASTVLAVRIGAVRMLFTGDAEGPEEDWLLAHNAEALSADILKVGHHGSATSTTPDFLAAVRPRVALVSVGAHNGYGHPDGGVIAALRQGASVLRTDQMGTVVLRTDGSAIEIEARDARWMVPARAAPP